MSDRSKLLEACRGAGVTLPMGERLESLAEPLRGERLRLPNRLACQPMEGADGLPDGSPGDLTLRRYRRFAAGGAGLIWAEAIAITEAGRANPRPLWLHEGNMDAFASMVAMMRETARAAFGRDIAIVAQLTHAGRYSKPFGPPLPVIACNNPYYEKDKPIPADRIISDDELRRLEDDFERAAALAFRAGFDGVDVKSCHRYLFSELFSAFDRPGAYGGSFENRTAFFRNCVGRARAACPAGRIVTTRMNAYDGVPNPFGWGQDKDDYCKPDLAEPLRLVGELAEGGMELIDVTMGNPYVNPHVNRPYKRGGYEPPEHPLKGVERMLNGIGTIQRAFPGLAVVASGLSYLGEAADVVAAGAVEQGMASVAGFGRIAFAYPDFAADILSGRGMQRAKSCLACTKCTELMRAGTTTGCPVRDQEVYLPLYRKFCMKWDG
jgi:2,4-dienoyl-CoA reductase-like NADH-dependent reductase (Old Yellow Enzyme family)